MKQNATYYGYYIVNYAFCVRSMTKNIVFMLTICFMFFKHKDLRLLYMRIQYACQHILCLLLYFKNVAHGALLALKFSKCRLYLIERGN